MKAEPMKVGPMNDAEPAATIRALIDLLEHEAQWLATHHSGILPADTVAAKQALVDRLCSEWPRTIVSLEAQPASATALLDDLARLAEVADRNAQRLERNIALTRELLDVVREELSRHFGAAPMVYGSAGAIASPRGTPSLVMDRRW